MCAAHNGVLWESRAARFLEARGLKVLAQGYRCRLGELDLVCHNDTHLIIVEVRARSAAAVVSAAASIGPRKIRRIALATRHYLMRHNAWNDVPVRFDVIAFDAIDSDELRVEWIQNAFDAS